MPDRRTDHANLDLETLHREVAFGDAGGKVIWQPRILEWYDLRQRTGQGLPAPYTGLSRVELYRALGCSDRLYDYNDCFVCAEDERVEVTQRDLDATDYEVVWGTPVGRQRAVYRRSPHSDWHMPVEWPITDEADLQVAMWRLEHMRYRFDPREFEAMRVRFRGLGAPTIFICRTTIQHLLVSEMGPEATFRMLRRDRGRCEAYFEALTRSQDRLLDLIEASPIEIINFGDNIHATVLSPRLFERYILPIYQQRASRLRAAGKFVHAHFDGDVKPLLPYLRDTGLSGIEAITPLPQGDVTLEETKAALGDMFLLDGIPAVYFDATYSVETLLDCARRCIDLFAPNLILGISDEMSATGEIERIRLVGEVVDDYNASLSAR